MNKTERAARKAAAAAHDAKMAELLTVARAIVATGKCPDCGSALRRNLSLAGWWQCGRLGADSHRAAEYRGGQACNFQTFTER